MTTGSELDLQVGYTNLQGTGLSGDEMIASFVGLNWVPITIDSSARDVNNPSGVTTDLRKGLIMWPDPTVGDRFTEFDAAAVTAVASKDAVVLAEDVPNIDNGSVQAKAYYIATFKPGYIFDNVGTGLTLWVAEECQRLKIRSNA
jgi:hypothetical protein